jgi:hypothetical protein
VRTLVAVLGLVPLPGVIFALILSGITCIEALASVHWNASTCRVIQPPGDRIANDPGRETALEYTYVVDGHVMTGHQARFDIGIHVKDNRRYARLEELPCWVDPAYPHDAVLNRSVDRLALGLLIGSLAWIALETWLIVRAIRGRRKLPN